MEDNIGGGTVATISVPGEAMESAETAPSPSRATFRGAGTPTACRG